MPINLAEAIEYANNPEDMEDDVRIEVADILLKAFPPAIQVYLAGEPDLVLAVVEMSRIWHPEDIPTFTHAALKLTLTLLEREDVLKRNADPFLPIV